jgi:hypothetical protein
MPSVKLEKLKLGSNHEEKARQRFDYALSKALIYLELILS